MKTAAAVILGVALVLLEFQAFGKELKPIPEDGACSHIVSFGEIQKSLRPTEVIYV